MNQTAVIWDFSMLWHQGYWSAKNVYPQYDLFDTTVRNIQGKIRTTERLLNKLGIVGYDMVFAEDREAKRKLELLPTYKGTRTNFSEDKQRAIQYLRETDADNSYRGKFCYSIGNEADDVIATLVRLVQQSPGMFAVIVSADQDLWQLLGPRTAILNPVTKALVTTSHIQKAYDVSQPSHVTLVKTVWGDAGDCIPNAVPRMQKQLLPAIRESDGTLEHFHRNVEQNWNRLTRRCQNLYASAGEQLRTNYSLVKLDDNCKLEWS